MIVRNITFSCALVLSSLLLLLMPNPAMSITAEDVVSRMEPPGRSNFIAGAVDMYSHLAARYGDRQKADCAVQWFFDTDDALAEVLTVFENFPDRDAVAVLEVLLNRRCGDG